MPPKNPRRSGFKNNLWNQGLKSAFPQLSRTRAELVSDIGRIHQFRNRVAHLEPVFRPQYANSRYAAMCRVTSDISPDVRSWPDRQSRVDGVLQKKL